MAAAALALVLYVFIPTAGIAPALGAASVALDGPVEIHASPLSTIVKVALYADGKPLCLEYNLDSGSFSRQFDLRPGQQVRVEVKVASLAGVTREFSSTYETVPPVTLEALEVDGDRYSPGEKISARSGFTFFFNKPLDWAAVSLDNGEPIELAIDGEDPARATFLPPYTLRQGEVHLLKVTATATDSAVMEPVELRASVVKPLAFFASVNDSGGRLELELIANAAFADAQAVREALETSLPGAQITVAQEKILITAAALDRSREYTVKINRAEGGNGSFLEAPLTMTLAFRSEPGADTPANLVSRGYVYTTSSTTSQSSTEAAAVGGAGDTGPPPGWPSCCPWPPS